MARKEIAGRLKPEELASLWGIAVGTLANWRAKRPRRGPRFVKIGRAIVYRMEDVVAFEKRMCR